MEYDYNKALSWVFSNSMYKDESEVLGAIVDALNKQLPDKPYYRKEEDAEGWACPNCYQGLIKYFRHCEECGQMLDWEDV